MGHNGDSVAPAENVRLEPRWGLAEALPAWILSAFISIFAYSGLLAIGGFSASSPERPGGYLGRSVGQIVKGEELRNDAVPIVWRMLMLVPGWLALLGAVWFLATIKGKDKRGWELRGRASDVSLGIAAGILTQVPILTIVGILMTQVLGDFAPSGRAQELVDSLNSPLAFIALFLGVAVGAPIVEELFYRGVVQGALVERIGDMPGLLVASIIFGLVHVRLIEIFPLAVAGFCFGILVIKTGRLLPAIIAHMTFNTFTLIVLVATTSA